MRLHLRLAATCLALLLAGAGPRSEGHLVAPRQEVRHLATLGRLWLLVKYAHPQVALAEPREWDEALFRALPDVRSASDAAAFAKAVASMLSSIADPLTRVQEDRSPGARANVLPHDRLEMRPQSNGSIVLDLRSLGEPEALGSFASSNAEAIAAAERVIVDLRGTGTGSLADLCARLSALGSPLALCLSEAFDPLQRLLVSGPTPLPALRMVVRTVEEGHLETASSRLITPARVVSRKQVTFVLDRHSLVPPVVLALQVAGSGSVVAVGELPDAPHGVATVALGGGHEARVRLDDLVLGSRRLELRPNVTVPLDAGDDEVYAAATETASATNFMIPGTEDRVPVEAAEASHSGAGLPSVAERVLAVYRLWGTIHYLYPYKRWMDEPWDGVLEEFLPRVLAARNELEYAQSIARMAARIQDPHVRVLGSKALDTFLGEHPAAVRVRFIEEKPIVTRVLEPALAGGIRVGDEILSVDAEPVEARVHRIEQHSSFHTKASRDDLVARRLLSGVAGSAARVSVRGADDEVRTTMVGREARFQDEPGARAAGQEAAQRNGPVWGVMDDSIGYVDLDRLEWSDVAEVFAALAETRAIVFDMRGYPRGSAWEIAPRINTRNPRAAVLFIVPEVTAGSSASGSVHTQPLPSGYPARLIRGGTPARPVYRRSTVMLIDERARSQSEHTGLFFKAANSTTFIGSSTTGVEGDVRHITLPGGLAVRFSSNDVRYPDFREVHGIGLVPDVEVKPTIAGIRAGRDEVLERALEYIKTGR